jgi:sugar lactone lactonase YvrE
MQSAMTSDRHSLQSSAFNLSFRRVLGQPLKLSRFAALCAVLLALACCAWNSAAAQNGFTGAQRVLGAGFNNGYGIKGIAVDSRGNVFVADPGNNAVKEVLAAGGYTTVNTLGSGFNQPQGVAVDGSGNVFVADTGNFAIKEVPVAGGYNMVNTLASGFANPEGVAVDSKGNVLVADGSGNAVKEILAVNGSIPASPAIRALGSGFLNPTGVAVDGTGNVFVADQNSNLVKEILAVNGSIPSSPVINTLATAHGIFNGPAGVAVDGSGNVWVAEASGFDLKEILAAGGYVTVNTPATGLHYPTGVAVDAAGNAYAANYGTLYQYQWGAVNFASQPVTSTSSTVQMNFTIPAGAQVGNFALTTLGNKNTDFADAGSSTCTAQTYTANTNCVINVNFTPLAPGLRRGALTVFDTSGSLLGFWRIYGTGLGPQVAFNATKTALTATVGPDMTNAMRVQADAKGNLIAAIWGDAASDPNSGSLVIFKNNGSGYNTGVTIASGLAQPVDLAIDGAGNVFVLNVADANNDPNSGSVLLFLRSTSGWASSPITVESGLNYPWGMAVDAQEDLFVSLPNNGQVIEYPMSSSGSGFAAPITLASSLVSPIGLALDGSGNLFVALYHDANHTPNGGSVIVLLKNSSGYGSPVTVASGLSYPAGVNVDTNDNLLVASVEDANGDLSSGAILEFPFTGSSFGSPVSLASGMTYPQGITLDSAGDIFFPDQGTNQLYELPRAFSPALSFAATIRGALSTDSPKTLAVYNIGNQPLDFTSIVFPADFPENATDSTDCSSATPLAANGTCTLTIDFKPAAVGSLNESLVLTDNALNAPGPSYTTQSVSLSGKSTAAPITPSITWATPAAITYGVALSSTQLDASTPVAGSFTYNPAIGRILSAGNQLLSATFTPTDTSTYSSVTTTVRLAVTKAPLSVIASNQTMTYGGSAPTLTGTLSGVVSGDGITASYSTTAPSSPSAGTYPITAALSDPNSKLANYTVTNTGGTLTVGKAALTVTVANQSMTYGGTVPALTGTLTGVIPGDGITATYTTTATSAPTAGSYPITATLNDPNTKLANYTVTITAGTLTVGKAASGVLIDSSSNPALVQNSITLTATVSSANGSPTGIVTFLDGSTTLGTGTLNATGVATIATAALASGSYTIAASYAGDANFTGATSASLTEVVEDFSLAISGGSAGITSVTATAGSSAVFSFTLSPTGSATFPAAITLSASGLPAGATATFSPATIAAGAGSTTVTLTIQLPQTAASLQPGGLNAATRQLVATNSPRSKHVSRLPLFALALLLLPFAGNMRRAGKKLIQTLPLLLFAIVGISAAACMTGCGGNATSTNTTPVTYTIQVTGTAGALSHSMDVTLIVDGVKN